MDAVLQIWPFPALPWLKLLFFMLSGCLYAQLQEKKVHNSQPPIRSTAWSTVAADTSRALELVLLINLFNDLYLNLCPLAGFDVKQRIWASVWHKWYTESTQAACAKSHLTLLKSERAKLQWGRFPWFTGQWHSELSAAGCSWGSALQQHVRGLRHTDTLVILMGPFIVDSGLDEPGACWGLHSCF